MTYVNTVNHADLQKALSHTSDLSTLTIHSFEMKLSTQNFITSEQTYIA